MSIGAAAEGFLSAGAMLLADGGCRGGCKGLWAAARPGAAEQQAVAVGEQQAGCVGELGAAEVWREPAPQGRGRRAHPRARSAALA